MRQHPCTKHEQSYIPLFGHTKCLHTLIEMGSPALAAVVPLINQIGRPTFPAKDKEVLIQISNCVIAKSEAVSLCVTGLQLTREARTWFCSVIGSLEPCAVARAISDVAYPHHVLR